jgi:hypothetical protein
VCSNFGKKKNSVAFSPQANYTDWATATCWRNLVPTLHNKCCENHISITMRLVLIKMSKQMGKLYLISIQILLTASVV